MWELHAVPTPPCYPGGAVCPAVTRGASPCHRCYQSEANTGRQQARGSRQLLPWLKRALNKAGPDPLWNPARPALHQAAGFVLMMANPIFTGLQNIPNICLAVVTNSQEMLVFWDFTWVRANLSMCLPCWIFKIYCCWYMENCIMQFWSEQYLKYLSVWECGLLHSEQMFFDIAKLFKNSAWENQKSHQLSDTGLWCLTVFA